MKNQEAHPVSSIPFPEVSAKIIGYGRGRGHERDRRQNN